MQTASTHRYGWESCGATVFSEEICEEVRGFASQQPSKVLSAFVSSNLIMWFGSSIQLRKAAVESAARALLMDRRPDHPFTDSTTHLKGMESLRATPSAAHTAFHIARDIASLPRVSLALAQSPPFLHTPVLLGHWTTDRKLPFRRGTAAKELFSALGCDVHWRIYEGFGHWYEVPDEIDDIVYFVQRLCQDDAEDDS
jgi:hypothetical protein